MKQQQLKTRNKRTLVRALIFIASTFWFIPGLLFHLLDKPPGQQPGLVNDFFQFSYQITPEVSSLEVLFQSIVNNPTSLLTFNNLIGLVVVMVFAMGCDLLSGYFKASDKMAALSQQAKEETIKDEFKREINQKRNSI